MDDIAALFARYGSDKSGAHSYGEFYQKLLEPLLDQPISLLEVGVADGGSLRAWADFLPHATIVGLDHHAQPKNLPERVKLVRADSTNKEQVDAVLDDVTFLLVLDDGCHWIEEQLATWRNLWPRVLPGGLYICEDIQRIDEARPKFEPLGFEFIDLRHIKNRGDDVLAIMRKS